MALMNPSRCQQFYTQHTDDVSAMVTHGVGIQSSTGDEKLHNLQRIMGAQ